MHIISILLKIIVIKTLNNKKLRVSVEREEEGGGRREVNLKLNFGGCLYLSGVVLLLNQRK